MTLLILTMWSYFDTVFVFIFYSILLVELQIVGLFLVQTGIESFLWKTAALHPFDRFHPDLWNLKPSVSHLEDGEGVQTWSEVAGWPVYFVSCVRWCEAGCQDVRVCVSVWESFVSWLIIGPWLSIQIICGHWSEDYWGFVLRKVSLTWSCIVLAFLQSLW